LLDFERKGGTPEEFEEITLGSLRKAVKDGNVEEGSFLCGAIAGLVNKVQTAEEIVKEIMSNE
jgi:enoyl-[acyl-carrier protein] reductase II